MRIEAGAEGQSTFVECLHTDFSLTEIAKRFESAISLRTETRVLGKNQWRRLSRDTPQDVD